jgi:geranylgeranyl diphosphate synthase, type I
MASDESDSPASAIPLVSRAFSSTSDDMARAPKALDRSSVIIGPLLRNSINRLPEPVRTVAGYHFGWCNNQGTPVRGGDSGKLLRPALALLCGHAVGGSDDWAAKAAAAVELVHNFSLLYDDVMDHDDRRRDRPAAWKVFGEHGALLTGNAMLVLAIELLTECGNRSTIGINIINNALLAMVDGQASDVALPAAHDVTVETSLAVAAAKTAALIECACVLIPSLAGIAPDVVEHLRAFGHHVGIAFQITDDIIGIWGDSDETGKPVGADIRSRKKSLPVVIGLNASGAARDQMAELYESGSNFDDDDVRLIVALLDQVGSRELARLSAREHLDLGLASLRRANPQPDAAAELAALARMSVRRRR